jgi:hypothetical protein
MLASLIPIKDYLWAGLVVALLISFGVYTVHERHAGAAHELAALKASTDKLKAETAKQTAALQAKATMAEQAYEKEQLQNANYQRTNPIQPVRLCLDSGSRAVVPKAGAANVGNAGASTAANVLQPVPAGNTGSGPGRSGPDISSMLAALGAAADDVSANLREYQSRAGVVK